MFYFFFSLGYFQFLSSFCLFQDPIKGWILYWWREHEMRMKCMKCIIQSNVHCTNIKMSSSLSHLIASFCSLTFSWSSRLFFSLSRASTCTKKILNSIASVNNCIFQPATVGAICTVLQASWVHFCLTHLTFLLRLENPGLFFFSVSTHSLSGLCQFRLSFPHKLI